eukprot:346188-Pleurochrysis_carterae.AAC.1
MPGSFSGFRSTSFAFGSRLRNQSWESLPLLSLAVRMSFVISAWVCAISSRVPSSAHPAH